VPGKGTTPSKQEERCIIISLLGYSIFFEP
jgi:hypothetical protein